MGNTIIPKIFSDYVVEYGVDGTWTYRKWSSGVSECWGKKSMSSINITGANGYLYDATTGTEVFPSGLFTSAPIVSAITHNPLGGRFLTLMIVSASANGVSFKVVSSISGSISFDYDIHAIGRWK